MSAEPAHRPLTPDGVRFCPLCGGRIERHPIGPDRKLEMVCGGCGFVYYLGQKVVAGTIAMEDGRILLTRRAIDPAHGKWTFPGGYVEWGEPVESAAVRETYEETGLTVGGIESLGFYWDRYYLKGFGYFPTMNFYYIARWRSGEPRAATKRGSLVVVGTGIKLIAQTTLEAVASSTAAVARSVTVFVGSENIGYLWTRHQGGPA